MKESQFRTEDLTAANALDAFGLMELVGVTNFSEQVYVNSVTRLAEEVDKKPGAQNGFIVYDNRRPIATLQVLFPLGDKVISQFLTNLVTDPEYRSMHLLNVIISQILDSQDPQKEYFYFADVQADTSFKGLKHAGVRQWLQKKGLKVRFCDDDPNQEAMNNGSTRVMLYRAGITVSDENVKNNI